VRMGSQRDQSGGDTDFFFVGTYALIFPLFFFFLVEVFFCFASVALGFEDESFVFYELGVFFLFWFLAGRGRGEKKVREVFFLWFFDFWSFLVLCFPSFLLGLAVRDLGDGMAGKVDRETVVGEVVAKQAVLDFIVSQRALQMLPGVSIAEFLVGLHIP
jgi:hypothetical protein